ncbi:unnamed protein product [Ilex paraguariensis]|uniref:Uncharacterized protein n=1 Tax=Ilex paraguariensis TaxID=185542 RepID=A0ABC8TC11_9AQUA
MISLFGTPTAYLCSKPLNELDIIKIVSHLNTNPSDAMSSTGASFAHVYVQQKRQREKMKRMEEERGRIGNAGKTGAEEKKAGNGKVGGSKKIHPGGGSVSPYSAGSFGEAKD